MTDYSDFLSQREVDSPVQPIDQLRNEVPSLDNQASNSFTLDEFQQTIPDDLSTFGSMNMEEYLDRILTSGESQSLAQIHVENSSIAISTIATMEAATAATMAADTVTIAAAPQFTIAAASPATINTAEQENLLRQGSLMLPSHLGQHTVEEVRFGIQQSQIQQEDNRATNVQRAGSVQRQTTIGEITLEDFLVNAGVLSPVSPLQQPSEEYQNINDRRVEFGPPGYIGRPVMALGEGGGNSINVPTYPATLPQSSIGETTFLPGVTIPSAYQPPAVCYGGRILTGAGGVGLVEGESPLSPLSSDGQEVDGVNQFGMHIGGEQNQIVSGPVQEVVERRQRRMLKNRASAARSRARKQAYTIELEAEIDRITKENDEMRQALVNKDTQCDRAALRKEIQQQQIEEEKLKCRVERLKRNKSWPE